MPAAHLTPPAGHFDAKWASQSDKLCAPRGAFCGPGIGGQGCLRILGCPCPPCVCVFVCDTHPSGPTGTRNSGTMASDPLIRGRAACLHGKRRLREYAWVDERTGLMLGGWPEFHTLKILLSTRSHRIGGRSPAGAMIKKNSTHHPSPDPTPARS